MAKDPDQLPEDISEEKSPSRFESAAGRVVRWLIFGLLIFVIGFVIIWLTYVGPRAAEIAGLQTQLSTAQSQIATQETELEEMQAIETHRQILDILVDVNAARFELASSRPDGAQAALATTDNRFRQLRIALGSDYYTLIDSMQQRLRLTLADIDEGDEFAALNDLAVLANNLITLERGLFAE